jgi:hypothetical protein
MPRVLPRPARALALTLSAVVTAEGDEGVNSLVCVF